MRARPTELREQRSSRGLPRPVEPRLYVLARPQVDFGAIAAFLDAENVPWRRTPKSTPIEELVEFAGRLCYMSFGERQSPKSNGEYLRHLVDQGHESVLEHAFWTFALTGVTRAFSHQLVRHRIGFSYSQLSQQYHDETDARVAMPRAVSRVPTAAARWAAATRRAQEAYAEIVQELHFADELLPERERLRMARTGARSVLPAATETKIVFTANARAIRHFLVQRGAILGDEEMRLVAFLLLETVKRDAPALFSDFTAKELDDGLPVVRQS